MQVDGEEITKSASRLGSCDFNMAKWWLALSVGLLSSVVYGFHCMLQGLHGQGLCQMLDTASGSSKYSAC